MTHNKLISMDMNIYSCISPFKTEPADCWYNLRVAIVSPLVYTIGLNESSVLLLIILLLV